MQRHFSRHHAWTEKKYFKFWNRINFKYEGMLAHSFDRFYVGTKFSLPTMEDLKFLPIKSDSTCNYLNVNVDRNHSQLSLFQTLRIIEGKLYHSMISIKTS